MRIVRIDTIKMQKRYVYDIPDMDTMQVGPDEFIIKRQLQNEDSNTIDWFEDNIDDYEHEEYSETEPRVVNTEWIHEDDEI